MYKSVATDEVASDSSRILEIFASTLTARVKQSGDQLTGSYTGALGEAKVTGTVKGDAAEWGFEHSEAGKIKYVGTIKGPSKIEGPSNTTV